MAPVSVQLRPSPWREVARILAVAACAALLAACGNARTIKAGPVSLGETFSFDEMYSQEFDTSPTLACEAARRALLGQGYIVVRADAAAVEASKDFQPDSDVHTKLSIRVSCVPQGTDDTLVFATALQENYVLRKSPNSVNLGASALGSLSLPIGMREDSLVRVASSTVQDAEFYRHFFARIGAYLPSLPIQRAPARPQALERSDPPPRTAAAPAGDSH